MLQRRKKKLAMEGPTGGFTIYETPDQKRGPVPTERLRPKIIRKFHQTTNKKREKKSGRKRRGATENEGMGEMGTKVGN